MIKQSIFGILLPWAVMASVSNAATVRFNNQAAGNNNWTDADNWDNDLVPGAGDVVRFNFGGAAGIIDSDVPDIGRVQIGVDEPGTLTIGPGGALSATVSDWNGLGAGGATTGTLNITGGILTTAGPWFMGVDPSAHSANLSISGGEMRVQNIFRQTLSNTTAFASVSGGLLDVDELQLSTGIIDIAGGTLVLRNGDQTGQVGNWATAGLMTANGGAGMLDATFDAGTGFTTVVAVPEPASVAMLGLAGLALLVRRRRA